VKSVTKGRTKCPKCDNEFLVDIANTSKEKEVTCPKCKNKFLIKTKCKEEKDGCSWEEHGEPRKTILSSIKPKTNKPIIAAILLICVFSIGITTSAFSEMFVESSTGVASGIGLEGSVNIYITDQDNNSLKNIEISLYGNSVLTDGNGVASFKNVNPGITTLEICDGDYINQRREIVIYPFFDSESNIILTKGNSTNIQTKEVNFMGCSLILAIFSIFPVLAMITCLKRHHIDVAIAGSLIGIFSFGFFFVGSILSIISFVLIWQSRDEFENGKKGKIF